MKRLSVLTVRYMLHNKKRTFMTIMGVVVSTILIFLVLNLGDGIPRANARLSYISMTDADITVCFVDDEDAVSGEDWEKIQALLAAKGKDGIKSVWYEYQDIYGINHVSDFSAMREKFEMQSGVMPKNPKEAIYEKGVSSEYGGVYVVGQTYDVPNYINGETEKIHVTGNFYTNNLVGGLYTVVDPENVRKTTINLQIDLMNTENAQEQADKLAAKYGLRDYYVAEELSYISEEVDSESRIMWIAIMGVILFFFAFFIIILIRNSFNISVTERLADYGMLRCIGLTRKQIIRMIFLESIIITTIGALIGLAIGIGLDYIVVHNIQSGGDIAKLFTLGVGGEEFMEKNLRILASGRAVQFEIIPMAVLVTFAIIYVVAAYSMISPIEKILKLSPVSALRQQDSAKEKKISKSKMSTMRHRGRVLTKFLGFNAGYAYKNILRKKGRFLGTVISMMVGIAIMAFASTATTSMYKTMYPDDKIYNRSAICMNEGLYNDQESSLALENKLKDFNQLEISGKAYIIQSNYFLLNEEDIKAYRKAKEEGETYHGAFRMDKSLNFNGISTQIEKSMQEKLVANVSPSQYDPDAVQVYAVRSASGDRTYLDRIGETIEDEYLPHKFQIIGYINDSDYENLKPETDMSFEEGAPEGAYSFVYSMDQKYHMLADKALMDQYYSGDTLSTGVGYGASGQYFALVKNDKEQARLSNFADEHGWLLSNNSEVDVVLNSVARLIYILVVFILVLVLINSVNVQSSDILLRAREFQLLSFIGMSRKSERRVIVIENVLTTLFALIPGTILGILTGKWAVQIIFEGASGNPMTFGVDWVSLIVTFAILLLASILIGRINKPKYLLEEN